jgi:hypothetical protein
MPMTAERRRIYLRDLQALDALAKTGEIEVRLLDETNHKGHYRLTFPSGMVVDFWPHTGRWRPHPFRGDRPACSGGLDSLRRFVRSRETRQR